MGYRYLLVRSGRNATDGDLIERAARLGLAARMVWAGAVLLASRSTPILRTPDGGAVIGHLFRRDGTPQGSDFGAAATNDLAGFRSFLIEHCWGDYVLFQSRPGSSSQLTVTRDPAGGIPCVYAPDQAVSFITDDISLAVRLGLYSREIDWPTLAHFLTHPYARIEQTALAGVRELLPGTSLHLDGGASRLSLAWSPWDFVAAPRRQVAFDVAASELRSVVRRTVASWAELDRSILVELSGGLDSSIVASCLQGTQARVACATLLPELPGADERPYAAAVADQLGVRLRWERLSVADAAFDAAPPESATGPGAGPLQHAADRIMGRAAEREGCLSFYSGGGGDTVFGYLSSATPAADAFREHGLFGGLHAVRDLANLHRCTAWRAASLTAKVLARQRSNGPAPITDLLHPDAAIHSVRPHPWANAPPNALPGDSERILGLAGTQLFREGLARGTSRPLRLPLLSQPVMETCLSIPSWMWNTGGVNRSVARAAFAGMLPRSVIDRRSKGNFLQYNGAVYQHLKNHLREHLMEGILQSHGLLDRPAIAHFFTRPQRPRDLSFMRIFDLCRAENWARHQR